MPPALLSRDQAIDRVMQVLRKQGYDGASLSELSKATGLGRSSLYHHFPDGKDDMVRAVLERLETQLQELLFTPLAGPGTPRRRLDSMVETLDEFYRGGREACVMANLVLGSTRQRFKKPLRRIFDTWIESIAGVLADAKLPREISRARAEDAVLRIEGALVLAGAFDDPSVFGRTLRQLPTELLAPARKTART